MNFKFKGVILQRLSKQIEKANSSYNSNYTQTDTQPVIWAKRQKGKRWLKHM